MHTESPNAKVNGNRYYYRVVSIMYICLCKGITDTDIQRALENGADSFQDVRQNLGVATVCGSCACVAKELVNAHAKSSGSALNSSLFTQAI